MKKCLLTTMVTALLIIQHLNAQTTRTAGTYTDLTNAITASADNDIIKITNNIVVTAEVAISKTLTINGYGYTITVPVTGLDESGKFNSSPSAFRVFNLSGAKTTTINNLNISGGHLSSGSGAAIAVGSGHTLHINYATISNSRAASGGGIHNNGGTIYMQGCNVIRNAAEYGGGFFNSSGGKMYVEYSTFSENRSTSNSGGGGAAENNGTGTALYVNNSTFSNNKSTEIGGAINNNNTATIYIANSSLTGNVAYGDYQGGAIGNNGGTVRAVNCLFAYNYRRASGSVTNPTTYSLDDFNPYSGAGNVYMYYCIYHATFPTGVNNVIGNIKYNGAANGSDNDIFSGGIYTRITDGTGVEIGHTTTGKVFQPFLYNNGSEIAPTLKTGSFTLEAANLGTRVGFTSNSGAPIIGYYNRTTSAWVNLLSSPASSYEITVDQNGTARSNPPAIGAIQGVVDNLYMLKVNYAANGSITGGTVYGDVYPYGTQVNLMALPNSGYKFLRWDYVAGGTGTASTSNPYTVTVDKDITLVPVFQALSPGYYNITYVGNGNTSGTAPAAGDFNSSTTLATAGSLERTGYIFGGWNTSPNGSGTSYTAGQTYSAGNSLILYAVWNDNFWRGSTSTDFNTGSNWGSGTVPATNADIVFAEDADNDLVLDQDRTVGTLRFSGAPYKARTGNFKLTASDVQNYSSTSYVQTDGTGMFCMNVADAANVLFPVGRSTYNPVSIENNTGSADNFCVKVLDELYLNGADGAVYTSGRVKRIWDITKDNTNSGSGINFVFNWNAGESENLTTPALFHYSSGWSLVNSGTTSSTATSLTYTGYTGTFSPFGITDINGTLPVSWLYFKVQKQDAAALLSWATDTETNNKYFVVEHSTNGSNWESLANIPGAGNSISAKEYQYVHNHPAPGMNYYRIRQQDADGRFTYSGTQKIQFQPVASLRVYPNPVVNGNIHVSVSKAGLLKLFTAGGQLVYQKQLGTAGQHQLNLQSLAKGVYRLVFEKESTSIVLQ